MLVIHITDHKAETHSQEHVYKKTGLFSHRHFLRHFLRHWYHRPPSWISCGECWYCWHCGHDPAHRILLCIILVLGHKQRLCWWPQAVRKTINASCGAERGDRCRPPSVYGFDSTGSRSRARGPLEGCVPSELECLLVL